MGLKLEYYPPLPWGVKSKINTLEEACFNKIESFLEQYQSSGVIFEYNVMYAKSGEKHVINFKLSRIAEDNIIISVSGDSAVNIRFNPGNVVLNSNLVHAFKDILSQLLQENSIVSPVLLDSTVPPDTVSLVSPVVSKLYLTHYQTKYIKEYNKALSLEEKKELYDYLQGSDPNMYYTSSTITPSEENIFVTYQDPLEEGISQNICVQLSMSDSIGEYKQKIRIIADFPYNLLNEFPPLLGASSQDGYQQHVVEIISQQ